MSNQPEVTQYDAGVYQIETTDPVDGGVGSITNSPLLALANRTNYLKKHLDDIESGNFLPDKLAPKDSPALTGTPTAPTQASGDISNKLATDSFVQDTVNGLLILDVSGGIATTLNSAQAGVAILMLTGALTANKAIVFPSVRSGHWQVINNTTGAFTLTCKTAAGTGVVVTQGASNNIYCDRTNIGIQRTDFISPVLTGTPTATKAPQFATGSQIINADALRTVGLQLSTVRTLDLSVATVALTVADVGSLVVFTGSGRGTLTLPKASTVPAGGTVSLRAANTNVSTNLLNVVSGDTLSGMLQGTSPAGVMRSGDSLVAVSDGASKWFILTDTTYNFVAQASTQQFASAQTVANSGRQVMPGGVILQWGQSLNGASTPNTVTFPAAFPNGCFTVVMVGYQGSTGVQAYSVLNDITLTGFKWSAFYALSGAAPSVSNTASAVAIRWQAIGW